MTRVAVLYGGISAEREVSLSTGVQVIAALREAGFDVTPIDVGADLGAVIAALTPTPDAVFNALHGRFGEDGAIQGVLDWLGIPYTHSGVRASALAMDKHGGEGAVRRRRLAGRAPAGWCRSDELEAADPLPLPYVVKPVNEGSSVGVEIVRGGDNRRAEIARAWRFGRRRAGGGIHPGPRTDRRRDGRPRAGGDGDPSPRPARSTTTSRNTPTAARAMSFRRRLHPDDLCAGAWRSRVAAHRALGCRGASRCDFRYDDTAGEPGRLVLLEINTQPGLTPTSLLPEQAAHRGMSFPQLCAWMVENAACRA